MHPDKPNRHSTRLKGFDYAGPGTFFVTICTHQNKCLFGRVIDKTMSLSRLGAIASREWTNSLARRPFIVSHAFVVMPNHVHGLVSFDPVMMNAADRESIARGLPPGSLGALLNRYKGAVSTRVRQMIGQPTFVVWQRNYYDHIVRDERDFDSILVYIASNPARWQEDRFNANDL